MALLYAGSARLAKAEPALYDRIMTRLFTAALLAPQARVILTAPQAHKLRHVLRRTEGDEISLFNGRDGEWTARIGGLGRKEGWAEADRQCRAPTAEPDIWLLFAPIKGDRIDMVTEKATELGASLIWPVITRRTVVHRVNTARMTANAIEAAEQCERLGVPEIRSCEPLEKIIRDWPAERRLFVLAERGAAEPVDAAFLRPEARGPAALLIGPEGGFAPEELDALLKLPFATAVGLGPRILRADTAALAALACWQALAGDGRNR